MQILLLHDRRRSGLSNALVVMEYGNNKTEEQPTKHTTQPFIIHVQSTRIPASFCVRCQHQQEWSSQRPLLCPLGYQHCSTTHPHVGHPTPYRSSSHCPSPRGPAPSPPHYYSSSFVPSPLSPRKHHGTPRRSGSLYSPTAASLQQTQCLY